MVFVVKALAAALLISFASWLSGKRPELAGFIIALPLTSLIAIAFSYAEHQNPQASITFARSILAAIPLSLLFFVPFLFADKLMPLVRFWGLVGLGLALLGVGYFAHQKFMRYFS